MKFLQKTLLLLLAILAILLAHIFVINFLPFPYNRLNTVFAILVFLITIKPTRQIIWLALILAYFLELLSGIPFGVGLLSLVAGLLTISWFQLNILTNRSVYIIFISALIGVLFYRFIFFILLTAYNYFAGNPLMSLKTTLIDTSWEALFSALEVFILYVLYSKFAKTLRKSFNVSY